MRVLKSVVGSFPPKKRPISEAIQWAVDLQLEHGIEVVSDGEQRADMISYFKELPGLGLKPTGPFVKERIMPFEKADEFVKLQDLRFVRDYLKNKSRNDVSVKVSITGPVTLGFACACNGVGYYGGIRDDRLYSDFASALKPLIEAVSRAGCYVQLDEPSLSIRVMEDSKAVKVVNEALSDVPDQVRKEEKLIVHVCGPLTKSQFENLCHLDAPVLSLAFGSKSVKGNVDLVSKEDFESSGKKLGLGCVSVQARTKDEVEPTAPVIERVKIILDRVGEERIALLHPDCGMRGTGNEALGLILDRVASSAEYIEKTR